MDNNYHRDNVLPCRRDSVTTSFVISQTADERKHFLNSGGFLYAGRSMGDPCKAVWSLRGFTVCPEDGSILAFFSSNGEDRHVKDHTVKILRMEESASLGETMAFVCRRLYILLVG